jgi:transposase InsO family protein
MFEGVKIRETLQDIIRGCDICQHNNPHNQSLPLARTQRQGSYPGEDWQIDFTHMQGVLTPVCFLVLVDTFTGWVEAFPYSTEKAQEVGQFLIQEIIPQFGLPPSLQSNNGQPF